MTWCRKTMSLAVALLVAGCAKSQPTDVAPAPAPLPDTITVVRVDTVRVDAPRDTVHERLAARLQVELLEREAEIADLRQKLDEAIREVVRTMSRLQTVATRAEAASAMAEAELAHQALRKRGDASSSAREVKRLLDQSAQEFARSNFAGAIYLANQGKNVARGASARASSAGPAVPGETPFAAPLTLAATTRANVREGPGTRFAVVRTLERGAAVQAVGYAGDWVRLAPGEAAGGWVLAALLERPQPAD